MPELDELKRLNDLDRVIHEPTRLAVVALLSVVESADFTFVMQQTGSTWGNLSSHLNKLEAAGYVSLEKLFVNRKPRTLLRLTEQGRAAFEEYRRQMRSFVEAFE